MQVATGLWDSWADDALLDDQAAAASPIRAASRR